MNWDESKLGDVAKVISGYAFKSKDFSKNKGIPVIKIKNIQKEKVEISDEYFLDESFLSINSKFHCVKDNVLISLTGSHITLPNSVVGRVAKYHYDFTSLLNQRGGKIVVTDENKLVNNYLYYYLCQHEVRTTLALFGRGGANQVNISPSNVESIKIDLPPLQTQKRIADILSTYDDLIENNLKRIKLLEQAAQNIYKEWFVNLRFPGHENTPINEETGLPVGWKIGVISDFGKVVTGKTPSTKRSDFYGGHIPFIKTPDMHGLPYVVETNNNLTELGSQAQLNKNLPANSVLVSCIGTAGVVAMTSKISQTNQQINSVVFDSTFKCYYFYCFAKKLKPLLEGLGSNGATMINVNKGKFENVDLNIPNESLLVDYAKIAEPMFKQMLTLSVQNQKLNAARDILLPRLMNRTIDV